MVTVGGVAAEGYTHVPDPGRAVAARFGAGDAGRIVLVRPDGYVAETVEPADVVRLATHERTISAQDEIAVA